MEEVLPISARATVTPRANLTNPRGGPARLLWRRFAETPWRQTVLIMILAAALRALLIIRAHGMMDFDEAVLGIQAERILQGAHPIYFSGQAYMGSWDAYLAAPLIAVFGPSATVLHVVTLVESLALIPIMGAIGARLYDERARMPAMLLAAIPPLFVATVELRMLGGYIETLILGAALLLLALVIADRWRAGLSTAWMWVGAGFLLGLGWWIDQLICYYMLAGVVWLAPVAIAEFRRVSSARRARTLRTVARVAGLSILAFCVGALPALIYMSGHGVTNVTYLHNEAVFGTFNESAWRLGVLDFYRLQAAPNVMGARIPVSWIELHSIRLGIELFVTTVTLAAILYALVRCARLFMGLPLGDSATGRAAKRIAWREALPLMLGCAATVIFWVSPTTSMLRGSSWIDSASRYAVPLTTVFTLVLIRFYLDLPLYLGRVALWTRGLPFARALISRVPAVLALCLFVAYLLPYVAGNDVVAMQSSYAPGRTWPVTGASSVVTYIQQRHIHYMWANIGYGNIIMYLDQQHVLCADYYSVVVRHQTNRFPDVYARVMAADRASFLVEWDPTLGTPPIASALDALRVQYTSAHFGDVWIFTPLSRTVDPAEIKATLG